MAELSEEQKRRAAEEVKKKDRELTNRLRANQAESDKLTAQRAAQPWHENLLSAIGLGSGEAAAKKKER